MVGSHWLVQTDDRFCGAAGAGVGDSIDEGVGELAVLFGGVGVFTFLGFDKDPPVVVTQLQTCCDSAAVRSHRLLTPRTSEWPCTTFFNFAHTSSF